MAKLLLEWSSRDRDTTQSMSRVKLPFTHEEIGQIIGTSRETVTRWFSDLKKKQILQSKGSTLLILDKKALLAMARGYVGDVSAKLRPSACRPSD
jgi:CRP/FNR family transcriptional regulator